jgi:predicted RNase H-like HicB family nuclease
MPTQKYRAVVEKHDDGFVAHLPDLVNGAVVAEGDTLEEALSDLRSAILAHLETFGPDSLKQRPSNPPPLSEE